MLIKAEVYLCIRNGEFKQQIWALYSAIGHCWCMENIMRLFKPIPNSPFFPKKPKCIYNEAKLTVKLVWHSNEKASHSRNSTTEKTTVINM